MELDIICAMLIGVICYVGWSIGTIKAQLEDIKRILEGDKTK